MRKRGRKKGSQAKGYDFRAERGWFATGGGPLKDEQGKPIKDRQTAAKILQAAYARHLLDQQAEPIPEDPTIFEACEAYLDYCKTHSAEATYQNRAGAIFDFTTGLPAGLRNKPDTPKKEREAVRIHNLVCSRQRYGQP